MAQVLQQAVAMTTAKKPAIGIALADKGESIVVKFPRLGLALDRPVVFVKTGRTTEEVLERPGFFMVTVPCNTRLLGLFVDIAAIRGVIHGSGRASTIQLSILPGVTTAISVVCELLLILAKHLGGQDTITYRLLGKLERIFGDS